MTVSSNKKSKDNRYRIDSGPVDSHRDAFGAEVRDDEDAIDRLLVNTGFDTDREDGTESHRHVVIDDLDLSGESETRSKPSAIRKIEPEIKVIDPDTENPVFNLMASIKSCAFAKDYDFTEAVGDPPSADIEIQPELLRIADDADIAPVEVNREEIFSVEDLIELKPVKQEKDSSWIGEINISAEDGVAPSAEAPPAINPPEPHRHARFQTEAPVEPGPWQQKNRRSATDCGTSRGPMASLGDSEAVRREYPGDFERFAAGQELANQSYDQLIRKLDAKTRKATIFSAIALMLGIAAIVSVLLLSMGAKRPAEGISASSGMAGLNGLTGEPDSKPAQIDSFEGNSSGKIGSKHQVAGLALNPAESGWYVNLMSFRQHGDAVAQASDFIRKGIRAEIIEDNVNGETWFRLRVGRFSSKEQASAYAEKIRKPMHLNSVRVGSN